MRPVSMLRGISEVMAALDRVSMTSRKRAPRRAETGSILWLFGPTMSREKWGITSPTQPMVPETHTEQAVMTVAEKMTAYRSQPELEESIWASSSDKVRMFIRQRISIIKIMQIPMGMPL